MRDRGDMRRSMALDGRRTIDPLRGARIGYAGYSRDWSQPGDRRRFVAYAQHRGLDIEPVDPDRRYDVVVVTHGGNLPLWIRRRRRDPNLRLVFELIDSYLVLTGAGRSVLKGVARMATGVDAVSYPHFDRTLAAMLRTADAVICSTLEQQSMIRAYNDNVHVSFDYFDAEIGAHKQSFSAKPPLKLAWEGQANTLPNLLSLAPVLNGFGDAIELHVVTDVVRFRHLGRFRPIRSATMLTSLTCPVVFHPWERSTFARDVTAADVAIIPIDLDNPFAAGKPENKLIMLWKMGMPVVVGDSPAYRRAMNGAGIDLVARTASDWRAAIAQLEAMTAAERSAIAEQGSAYAARCYSSAEFLGRFDAVFESICRAVG